MRTWMELETAQDVSDAIVALYTDRGSSRYDERVTQTEHGLQCAALAMADQAERPVIVAALLHDIGHLLLGEDDSNKDFLGRDLHHEDVGSRFLANWFSAEVTEPIRLHVPAKRYLVSTDAAYHDTLSEASVRSLIVQGGPMTDEEVADFEGQPGYREAVQLRRWDDLGKVRGAPTPDLAFFGNLVNEEATVGQ